MRLPRNAAKLVISLGLVWHSCSPNSQVTWPRRNSRALQRPRRTGLEFSGGKLFHAYWEKFPWDLPLDQEPDPNALPPPPPQTAEEAFTSLGLNLSPEETERKGKIQKDTKAVSLSPSLFFPR
jgi:hypothetical protein